MPHTAPVSLFWLTCTIQWRWSNSEPRLAPEGCEKAHFSLTPPPPLLLDWFSRRRQIRWVWLLLLIHPAHRQTEKPWRGPELHPFYAPTLQSSPCSLLPHFKLWLVVGEHTLLDYTHPSQEYWFNFSQSCKAQQTNATWGAGFHVSPRTTSDPPARVSFAGTGEDTCPGVGMALVPLWAHVMCLTSACFKPYITDQRLAFLRGWVEEWKRGCEFCQI